MHAWTQSALPTKGFAPSLEIYERTLFRFQMDLEHLLEPDIQTSCHYVPAYVHDRHSRRAVGFPVHTHEHL